MSGRLAAGFVAGVLLLAGCESGQPDAIEPRETVQPHEPLAARVVREIGATSQPGEKLTNVDRLDVFAGQALVLPLDVAPTGPVVVTLDDGRRLPGSLHSIAVTVPADPSLAGGDVWLPSPGVWQSRVGKGAASDPWVLEVDMPSDGAGHDVVINGWRVRANWLPGVEGLPRGEGKGEDPWRAARPPAAPAEIAMSPRVYPESQSPISRWRWRLVADGLAPDASVAPFADLVIEALAQQNEDRWRVALAWLWGANTDTAHRLKQRLAAVVDFGNGVYAPAWPTDHGQMDHLLAGLLDPAITPSRRVLVAEQWLKGCTSAVAWVMDDGGTLDQSRRVLLPTIGVASLLDHSTLGWSVLSVPGASTPPGPDALRPFGAMMQVASVVAPATKGDVEAMASAGVGEVSAHLGAWSVRLPVAGRLLSVAPPGLAIGPMWADQTMEAWLEGKAALAVGGMMTAGLLQQAPSVAGADGKAGAWEVFVECRGMQGTPLGERGYPGGERGTPLGERGYPGGERGYPGGERGTPLGERGYPAADERDEVRLYFGAFGRGSLVRVTAKGSVTGGDVDRVPIGRRGEVWSFRLSLPPGAVEADGVVRLGVVRVDGRGRRSAWPRPMLPWQEEPARAALDTKGWGGGAE